MEPKSAEYFMLCIKTFPNLPQSYTDQGSSSMSQIVKRCNINFICLAILFFGQGHQTLSNIKVSVKNVRSKNEQFGGTVQIY